MIVTRVIALTLVTLAVSSGSAAAATHNDDMYKESAKIVASLLIVALVLESAFATIFNWRVFRTYFSSSGWKTIVMVIASWLVVTQFSFDATGDLFNLYSNQASPGLSGFITALVLAGGSSGINRLLQSLGYRSPTVDLAQPLQSTQAWVAVRVKRSRAVGQIQVHIGETQQAAADLTPLAGTIGSRRPTLAELLFRNPNRFPANDGYSIDVGKTYQIVVEGRDNAGNTVTGLKGFYRFAPRAIVDFDVTV